MGNFNVPVLIVGAGPTGLALACDLSRRKVQFRLIDKKPSYFVGSKAKGLQPRSLEVMDDFGIVDEIVSLGRFHLPFRGYDGATVLGEKDMHEGRNPTPSTPYASPLLIPQWRTEERLRALLERQGGTVELATELVSLEQDEHGVTALLKVNGNEETVKCQYLVAADGGRSFVRKFLQVPFEGETWKDERMYVGDVRLQGLDREAWHSWPKHPDGWLALCPFASTDTYQFQAQVPAGEAAPPSLALFQQIVQERTTRTDIEITDAPWLSLYQVNVRMVSRYRVGRVFLAGDAAHVHSPAGGQGMNTGIQDAYNLGWKLESVLNGAPDSLLDAYEEERMPVAAAVLGISSKLYRQITTENDDRLRGDAVTLQLGISYRSMSLSQHSGKVDLKIAAGDRAPDAPGQDGSGNSLRLFDVFRGPQFTLLRLFSTGNTSAWEDWPDSLKRVDVVGVADPQHATSSGHIFVDAFGHFAAAYGGSGGEYVLVRPDGYVGWMGSQADLTGLERFLSEVSPLLAHRK